MCYSYENIEVFVLTFNRSFFLEQTLKSILQQSEQGFKFTVLDNGSTDETDRVLEKFKSYDIKVYKSAENLGWEANFKKAQSLAEKEWAMVFHDDDLLHPEYISTVLNTANRYEGLSLIGAGMSFESDPKPVWQRLKGKIRYFEDVEGFAAYLYNGFPFHFGSAVYKTKYFTDTLIHKDIYGKIADRPFLFDVTQKGMVAVLTEPYIKYRCHEGQSSTRKTGPFLNELIALHTRYFEYLGDNIFNRSGRIFVFNNYKHLHGEISRQKELAINDYLAKSLMAGATTKRALFYGRCVYYITPLISIVKRVVSKIVQACKTMLQSTKKLLS